MVAALACRGGFLNPRLRAYYLFIYLFNAPPDVRHTMQVSLARAGHVGARIPEAQVNVLFAGPPITLVGHWIRGGEGLAPHKGMV